MAIDYSSYKSAFNDEKVKTETLKPIAKPRPPLFDDLTPDVVGALYNDHKETGVNIDVLKDTQKERDVNKLYDSPSVKQSLTVQTANKDPAHANLIKDDIDEMIELEDEYKKIADLYNTREPAFDETQGTQLEDFKNIEHKFLKEKYTRLLKEDIFTSKNLIGTDAAGLKEFALNAPEAVRAGQVDYAFSKASYDLMHADMWGDDAEKLKAQRSYDALNYRKSQTSLSEDNLLLTGLRGSYPSFAILGETAKTQGKIIAGGYAAGAALDLATKAPLPAPIKSILKAGSKDKSYRRRALDIATNKYSIMATGVEQAFPSMASEAYLQFKDIEDVNGNKLDKNTIYGASIISGVINSAIEFGSLGFLVKQTGLSGNIFKKLQGKGMNKFLATESGQKLFSKLGKSKAGAWGSSIAMETMTETIQGDLIDFAGEFAKMRNNKKFGTEFTTFEGEDGDTQSFLMDMFKGDIADLPATLATTAFVVGGIRTGSKVIDIGSNAIQGKKENKTFADIVEVAKRTKTLGRSPEAFENITSNTYGEVDVVIRSDKIREFFQDDVGGLEEFMLDNPEIARQMSNPEALFTDVSLPANKAITIIADERYSGLQEHVRLSDDSILPADFEEEYFYNVERYSETNEKLGKEKSSVDKLLTNVENEIVTSGETKETARNVSQLYRALLDTAVESGVGKYAEQRIKDLSIKADFGFEFFKNKEVDEQDLHLDYLRDFVGKVKHAHTGSKTAIQDLLQGSVPIESGMGKELLARGVHKNSRIFTGGTGEASGADLLGSSTDSLKGGIDTVPIDELFGVIGDLAYTLQDEDGNSFANEEGLADLLVREIGGEFFGANEESVKQDELNAELENLARHYDIDLLNMTNEEARQRIEEVEGQSFYQTTVEKIDITKEDPIFSIDKKELKDKYVKVQDEEGESHSIKATKAIAIMRQELRKINALMDCVNAS